MASSETERAALKKRSETQNRSAIQIFTTKHVSAPAQCHARHPPAPPNTSKSCRTDQGPIRDAAAAAGPEQTVLTDRAPAAGSTAVAGSPQAARWQVRAAVSDPNCSRPAPVARAAVARSWVSILGTVSLLRIIAVCARAMAVRGSSGRR
jgi:hypothetical protein